MKIEYAPSPSQGVTTLMAVNDVADPAPAPSTQVVLLKGAAVGLAAAFVLGSKRKVLFALAGAVIGYYQSTRR